MPNIAINPRAFGAGLKTAARFFAGYGGRYVSYRIMGLFMLKIVKLFIILVMLLSSIQVNAADFPLSSGVWEVVKLDPAGSKSLLNNQQIFYVFFQNGNLLECSLPKNSNKAKVKSLKYHISNDKLVITKNGESTEHPIKAENGLVKMGVPFGEIWLKQSEVMPLKFKGIKN